MSGEDGVNTHPGDSMQKRDRIMIHATARIAVTGLLVLAAGYAFAQEQAEPRERVSPPEQLLRDAAPIPAAPDPVYMPESAEPVAVIEWDPGSGQSSTVLPSRISAEQAAALNAGRIGNAVSDDPGTLGTAAAPIPVFDSSQFPIRTVHKLLLRFRVGALDYYYACSATAVSEFHLLTTGNCIYNHDPNGDGSTSDQGFAAEVWAWAAQTDRVDPFQVEDFPFGLARATWYRVPNNWINNQNLNDDWALVTLDRRVGEHTGWMARETDVQASTVGATGYPIEVPFVPAGNLLQYFSASANNVTGYLSGRIQFDAFIFGGQSGGPVWRNAGTTPTLQGIISTTDRAGNAEATRLRSGMLNDINGFIVADETERPPTAHPDLIEYLLETGQKDLLTNVQSPGGSFDLDYNVFNAGHAPSGSITVDFYLSTNDIVSTADTKIATTTIGSLDPFFFFRETVSVPIPPSMPPGTYWVGWIANAGVFEPNAFDNAVVIASETLLVSSGGGDPDIRVEPVELDFRAGEQLPREKIFVEIDWMEDATHSHRPSQAVIDTIVATFAAAGHEIVIDVSNAIPHADVIAVVNSPGSSPQIQSLISQHFDNIGDNRYYYSIWGHNYSFNGQLTGSSGIADLPGRVHLVTLGNFPDQVGTPEHQVGTFIHEFGHNIGQKHGGVDHGQWKPNYLSVMNYHFQLEGIGPGLVALGLANSGAGFDDFSYSNGQAIDLNEGNLNENIGIGLGKSVDWNCNGSIESGVSADLQARDWCQANAGLELLTDFDNWSDLRPYIRTANSPGFGHPHDHPGVAEPCISWHEHRSMYDRVRSLRMANELPPSQVRERDTETLLNALRAQQGSALASQRSFTIYNDGNSPLNITQIALSSPAPWISWTPSAPFTIQPGGSRQITVAVDAGSVPNNNAGRTLLIESNDPNENPFPGGVRLVIDGGADTIFVDRFED